MWTPTMNLRVVQIYSPKRVDQEGCILALEQLIGMELQQEWKNEGTGETQWRQVPIVNRTTDSGTTS